MGKPTGIKYASIPTVNATKQSKAARARPLTVQYQTSEVSLLMGVAVA